MALISHFCLFSGHGNSPKTSLELLPKTVKTVALLAFRPPGEMAH